LTQVTSLPLTALGAAATNPLAVVITIVSQAVTVLILTCFNVVLKAWPAQAYKELIGPAPPAAAVVD
jgi:hypothetical protein